MQKRELSLKNITYLLNWFKINKRDLPWRKTNDPYKIWISEIILQQTRINQGTDYYLNFIKKFPDVFSLANAELDSVLLEWQGLGYYTRAANLHKSAKIIVEMYSGVFPDKFDELINLPGIGDYSASAIISIAFGLPFPAIDGNVKRVFSRLFLIEEDINSPQAIASIKKISEESIRKVNNQSGNYNQAMMELGALICVPSNPDCIRCPLQNICMAKKQGIQNLLPKKNKKTNIKHRHFIYLVLIHNNNTYITKRIKNDIWSGLYEFILIPKKFENIKQAISIVSKEYKDFFDISHYEASEFYTHKLTHQEITAVFFKLMINKKPDLNENYFEVSIENLNNYAFPALIVKYLKKNL